MKIIFFHVGPNISLPTLMVGSARRFTDEVVMLTDKRAPEVPGCSEIHRYDGNLAELMMFRMEAYAAYNQPGVYVDTDMIIQRDLSPIMALDFDMAVTHRIGRDIPGPSDDPVNITETMPYNGGMIFYKHPGIFPVMANLMRQLDPEMRNWWGDQIILAESVKHVRTMMLPDDFYNLTYGPDRDLSAAWVVHFKGGRKKHMASYFDSRKEKA